MNKLITLVILLFLAAGINTKIAANERLNILQEQIKQKNDEITIIEKEIEKYQEEIDKTLQEQNTLKNQIRQLQATTNKLNAEINLTVKQIDNTGFSLQKIQLDIEEKDKGIDGSKNSLMEIIRELNEQESQSLLEILLANNDLSDFFANIERMESLQKYIKVKLEELKNLKSDLENDQVEKAREKANLEQLNDKLGDQKKLVENNKTQKNNLLKKTKNQEANYRKALEEKIAKRDLFLSELSNLESQLKIEIDPTSIPAAGSGVLGRPVEGIITQFFGNTPFATRNPQVYGGQGHNGIDFRASVGTEVMAGQSGIVEEIGNTDKIRGCYSYGKWILIKHGNGLSTLYAHLSLIKVSKGQNITRGQFIGYSGKSGFATGTHLHFGVYATQGVKVTKFTNSINCKNAVIPIADPSAYLNPLSYL